ncbi:hypothetical protein T05_854 [Trichinella murrelli]|uniref:Uncharacterized protein n=1 Tax=Trichinella murrelli TaxID=144512 RepID=A0A0V0TB08_9BILA|nr:hypothetical protein T05_854 [Trichinella murrelli]
MIHAVLQGLCDNLLESEDAELDEKLAQLAALHSQWREMNFSGHFYYKKFMSNKHRAEKSAPQFAKYPKCFQYPKCPNPKWNVDFLLNTFPYVYVKTIERA